MPDRAIRWGRPAPWLAAAGGAGALLTLVGIATGILASSEDGPFFVLILTGAVAAWGVAGGMVGRRRPENPIGLLLAGQAFLLGSVMLVDQVAQTHPGSAIATFNTNAQGYIVVMLLIGPLVILLFPDGRPPSRRWRVVAWMFAVSAITGLIGLGLAPEESVPWSATASILATISGILGVTASALAIVSAFLRHWRSRGAERAQIRWLAIVAIMGALGLIVSAFTASDNGANDPLITIVGWTIFLLSLAIGLPAAIGIAVLRYRLWELDVVVKKTVVALALTLAFGVPVLVILGLSSRFLLSTTRLSSLVGGIVLGLLVVPLVRLARRVATRITYGRRASQYEVLTAFGERVEETYSVVDVLPRMVQVLTNATGATSARVLLRVGPELREEAAIGEPTGDEHVVPVRYEGEELGALAATFPLSDPIDASKRRLMENLAAQAGLVLRNARLIEELRASRQRLVAAQDEERRKIERNIHDGAQQQLVALTVKLRLAQGFVTKDPPKAESMLSELQSESQAALDDLRDLARGIYPPLLADRGLAEALQAQARKAAVATTVESDGIGRYPAEVESAVYFCSLEALNNIAKYARATAASVRLSQEDGHLRFAIRDDGEGFDVASAVRGIGLQGMADRVEAVGGRLEIVSAPGKGTTVTGSIPVEVAP